MSRTGGWLFGLTAAAAAVFVHLLPAPDQAANRGAVADSGRQLVESRKRADERTAKPGATAARIGTAARATGGSAGAAAPVEAPAPPAAVAGGGSGAQAGLRPAGAEAGMGAIEGPTGGGDGLADASRPPSAPAASVATSPLPVTVLPVQAAQPPLLPLHPVPAGKR